MGCCTSQYVGFLSRKAQACFFNSHFANGLVLSVAAEIDLYGMHPFLFLFLLLALWGKRGDDG